MKHLIPYICCSLMIVISLGCGFSTEKRRPASLEKQYDERSVKIISEAQVLREAEILGDSVTKVAQGYLMGQLIQKIENGNYANAVGFCSKNAQSITDSIGNAYSIKLRRVSLKNRSPQNVPNSLERNLLEAYAYSADKGEKLGSNLQFFNNKDSVLYNKPIFIASELCLNCHGTKDNINKLTRLALDQAYPQDSAHGYQMGDFRALWSIGFSKKQLIQLL